MSTGDIVIRASPFPTIDLDDPQAPYPGLAVKTPAFCERKFSRGGCADFYQRLATSTSTRDGEAIGCPYGFTVWPIRLDGARFAITSLVPFPRKGWAEEGARAKDSPASKIDSELVSKWIAMATTTSEELSIRQANEVSKRLEALHEVRALNGVQKAIAERICQKASPSDPEGADPELVRIWKASELISVHLDALDVLANPESSPNDHKIDLGFYPVVDKVFRLYKPAAEKRRVTIRMEGRSFARVLASKRTIHIIPSVFINNAVKYSSPGDQVTVFVREEDGAVRLDVSSRGPRSSAEEERMLFTTRTRGQRALQTAEGSGTGLVTAKKVADQHGAKILAVQTPINEHRSSWCFSLIMPMRP